MVSLIYNGVDDNYWLTSTGVCQLAWCKGQRTKPRLLRTRVSRKVMEWDDHSAVNLNSDPL